MMKKHLVEGVVPVIIELKRGMEAARHPLLGDLMAATAAMLKDYKNEVRAAPPSCSPLCCSARRWRASPSHVWCQPRLSAGCPATL